VIAPDRKVVLSMGAHPDDAEFLCAGTLALLQQEGWEVHIASLAAGDKGSAVLSRAEISRIRLGEGQAAADLLGGQFHCLDCEDIYILYDRETINRATALMRRVKPSLVITTSPSDYMVDHDVASRITQTACFTSGIKNMEVDEDPYEPVPCLYYMDPVELKDRFGQLVRPGIWVDITSVMETKAEMLCCHASQRDWLLAHHGIDEYVDAMKAGGRLRGREIEVAFAEGFRQHLGHSFPQEDLLKSALGERVHTMD
jgi:LmbE family N-acetylglucosaminyl deacetylase